MIQEFSFLWNGRQWNGYLNALANETVIAHFEDDQIRETVGLALAYSRSDSGSIFYHVNNGVQQSHAGIYDAILKGVEVKLGKPLQHYLN